MASSFSNQTPLLVRSPRTPLLFLENGLMKKDNRIRKLPAAKMKISGTCSAMAEQSVNVSATVKLLNSMHELILTFKVKIESSFTLTARLSVEGPLRIKEEYVQGTLESPKVDENSIPEQLRGAFGWLQQIPVPLPGGLKVPLGGTFERFFMISYLDVYRLLFGCRSYEMLLEHLKFLQRPDILFGP